MATITTSRVVVELLPNAGNKEIVIETPLLTRGASDEIQVTLADYGMSAEGPIAVRGYMLSASYGIITTNEPITSVIGGTLTISSTAATVYPARQVYRVVGTSL